LQENFQTPKITEHYRKGKVSPLVDGRSHDNEEKDKSTKKKISKNTKQRRNEGEQEELVHRREKEVPNGN
jgi:hypothetical protein